MAVDIALQRGCGANDTKHRLKLPIGIKKPIF
jgi:hypothetical protein